MSKREIVINLNESTSFEKYEKRSIDSFIDTLNAAIDKGATHFVFDYFDGDSDLEMSFLKVREETDEEFKARLSNEAFNAKISKEQIEAIDRKEYERLKAKYETFDERRYQSAMKKYDNL